MNQEKQLIKYIKDFIMNERFSWKNEQDIYTSLVENWYEREYIVQVMIHSVHPIDIKKSRLYNFILILLAIVWTIVNSIQSPDYFVFIIIINMIFIYFFFKKSITAYYWYLFISILNLANIIILINTHSISLLLIISIVIILLPVYFSRKMIQILLPHIGWKWIWITANGVHIFPEKLN